MKITQVTRGWKGHPPPERLDTQLVVVTLEMDGTPYVGYVVLHAVNGATRPLKMPTWFRKPGVRQDSIPGVDEGVVMPADVIQQVEWTARSYATQTENQY